MFVCVEGNMIHLCGDWLKNWLIPDSKLAGSRVAFVVVWVSAVSNGSESGMSLLQMQED